MQKSNACAIFENGKIKYFTNVSLLATYLRKDPDTLLRHKRNLKKEGKPLIKYYDATLVDYEPEIISNKKP